MIRDAAMEHLRAAFLLQAAAALQTQDAIDAVLLEYDGEWEGDHGVRHWGFGALGDGFAEGDATSPA
jgi:hypothetical protein